MRRVVNSEWLDRLSASSPEAIRARTELRRINRMLGHARILSSAYERHMDAAAVGRRPLRISELGAGDGWLLLQLAREWAHDGVTADAELVDLHYLLSAETRRAFLELNWTVTQVTLDARMWLARPGLVQADLIMANLFLHHFEDDALREMFGLIAERAECFIACEPRRSDGALAASRLLRLAGFGPVTRHDAPISVRAGFEGRELTALWPDRDHWFLTEEPAGRFSHCFVARRL